jgi:hypothetical protein
MVNPHLHNVIFFFYKNFLKLKEDGEFDLESMVDDFITFFIAGLLKKHQNIVTYLLLF